MQATRVPVPWSFAPFGTSFWYLGFFEACGTLAVLVAFGGLIAYPNLHQPREQLVFLAPD